MDLYYTCVTLLLTLAPNNNKAAFWNPETSNDAIIYKCTGSDVNLTWNYVLPSGDRVNITEWFYNNAPLAVEDGNGFNPSTNYAGRVEHIPNTGSLLLKKVTVQDSGKYCISVRGHTGSQSTFTLNNTLTLDVADSLRTTDHELYVVMNPSAVLNRETNQWSAELLCQNFTYLHTPPFDVTWTTPPGSFHSSGQYKDGQFSILLPLPIKGGNYTCRVSASAAGTCFARDIEASAVVDAVATTLAILEAKLTARVDTKKAEIAALRERSRLAVSFHTGYLKNWSPARGEILVPRTVYHNQGNGYRDTTGIFTAPVNGTYYFIATTGPQTPGHWAGCGIMLEHKYVGRIWAEAIESGVSETGHAVVHMKAGQRVWLQAEASEPLWGCYFSGFLVSADP